MDHTVTKLNQELEEKKELLKKTVCAGATDAELELFINVCNHTGLNPFFKQIYSLPIGGKRTTIISIDGFRLIAERTGRYMPGKETTFQYGPKDELISATSYIKKMAADGSWHEFSETARWDEYAKAGGTWKSMPHVMLSKCSESRVLRRGFPAEFSGVYSREELDKVITEEAPIADVVEKPIVLIGPKQQEILLSRIVEESVLEQILKEFGVDKISNLAHVNYKLALHRIDELQQTMEVANA